MTGFLTPVRNVETRPDPDTDKDATRYVRSYLWMRVGIGVLGIGLPLVLVFFDKAGFHGNPFPRGSLSVYYYSGMRDEFVGILSATGIFLITYKVAERDPHPAFPDRATAVRTRSAHAAPEADRRIADHVGPLHRLRRVPRIPCPDHLLFRRAGRQAASAGGDATLTGVLAMVPLDLHLRDGSGAPVDRDHTVGGMAATGLADRRMGLSVGVRRLMAGERRRTRHALRQAR
jgi:hypothetical protein